MSTRSGTGTRERVVDAAVALIESGGYAAATVAAIAERAGVSTGALYRHFPSKADLFLEVLRATSERELEAMAQAAAAASGFAARFEAVISTYARSALENPRAAWALVYEPVDPLVDAERLAHRREYRRRMASLLAEGIERHEIPAQDPDLTAAAVVGAIAEVLVSPVSPLSADNKSQEQIVRAIVAFCRGAVGAEPLE